MSRTHKHAPYWVLLNRYGVEDHNHTFRYRYSGATSAVRLGKIILDEDGKPVLEDHHEYRSANWVAKYAPRTKTTLHEVKIPLPMWTSMRYTVENESFIMYGSGRAVNPLWQEAQQLVNEGKGDTLMIYRTYTRPKRVERVVELAQHCTADEPVTRWTTYYWSNRDVPCTKKLPPSFFLKGNRGSWDKAAAQARHGGRRVRQHTAARNLVNAYNSGEDLDDYEQDLNNISEVDYARLW